jgi:hypothetical protein
MSELRAAIARANASRASKFAPRRIVDLRHFAGAGVTDSSFVLQETVRPCDVAPGTAQDNKQSISVGYEGQAHNANNINAAEREMRDTDPS